MNFDSFCWTHQIQDSSSERVDHYLARQLPEYSRAQIQKWIKAGQVLLNQIPVKKTNTAIRDGDFLSVTLPQQTSPAPLTPQNIPLDIIYQDDHLVVLNKPAGLVVHEGIQRTEQTLVHSLLYHFPQLSDLDPTRPGLVHRLDLETSGLLLIAKTNSVHQHLADQFAQRTIEKRYLALVRGVVKTPQSTVDQPLGRHPKVPTKRCILPQGKPALTFFSVKQTFPRHTLLEAYPKTGRTHQIRVHLHFLGYPLVGEKIYGKDPAPLLSHHALHAASLRFQHPQTNEVLTLEAPPPDDFQKLLGELTVC